ncbi:type 1 glutamine amidotransferase [Halapricum desulfuricans]|uniref:GMP synthase - Glutamine amidotransferase domain n=1 Tax=Halapricum desulfuricans TaxID=2841257 RepID=A0A897N418_9EURY|nr:type 1 glutamine amidotransferase [Halapricum desulfuricans]QSG05555.1 GMP synthase - Glutamine amidotransferase domain [Halapricum desulfuricans]
MVEFALLDASVGETPVRRNFRRELQGEVTVFEVSEGELPPDPGAFPFDGAIISGSQCSAYDDRAWIADVEDWARTAHEAGIPMLGVCWGHQLLAEALGGRVEAMGERELGYRTVRRAGASQLFNGVSRTFTAFETHTDAVVELPGDARVIARNDAALQGFQLGRTYGVQFHPEYDLEAARWVIEGKDISDEQKHAALETVTEDNHAAAAQARLVFENFRRVVAGERVCRIDSATPGQ